MLVRLAFALAAALALAVPEAPAKAPMNVQLGAVATHAVSCDSGRTLFSDAGTRVFRDANDVYLCSARVTTPMSVLDATYMTRIGAFRRFGSRIGFADEWADGVTAGFEVGWIDAATGATQGSGDSSDVLPFGHVQSVAVARAGSVAALVRPQDRRSQLVVYARFGAGKLGTPRTIARVPAGDAVPWTLRITGARVAWRTRSGRRTSARVSAVAAAASRTTTSIGSHMSCNAGKTLFHEGKTRVFQSRGRTGWYVCSAWLRRPRRFAEGNDGSLDATYSFHRTGRRVAFVWSRVGGDDLGWGAEWVDVSTGRSKSIEINPKDDVPFGEGEAVVADADGSVAFVETVENGGGLVIGYAPFADGRFGPPRVLVENADVTPASLAITGGTVTWKTTTGESRSVPTGSLALGCPAPVFADDGAQISAIGDDWFVCSGGARRVFYWDDPGAKLSAFRRVGHRIAFVIDFPIEPYTPDSQTVGYVDERTAVMEIADAQPDSTLQAFTIDAAGGIVQLSRLLDGTSQVTYAPNDGTRLLAPVVLARGDIDPASLSVSGETVTWSGGSAPLPLFGCASGETRYAAGATRIFAAETQLPLYFCSAAVRTPKRLPVAPGALEDELHVFGASGPRLLLADFWWSNFITGWDAAWIDVRNGAYHATGANFGTPGEESGPLPYGSIIGMAAGSDGAIAMLERLGARHLQLIAYARFGGGRLGRLRELTRIAAGDVVPSSLRLARGKVTWRTSSGRRGGVPTRARG